jgi:hypothetical protein
VLSVFFIAIILHGQNMLEVIHLEKILKINDLLNNINCYCKLTIAMADFITNRGGTNKFVMEYVISGDYLKLIIGAGISLLNNAIS